jgi:hypothetical protein
MSSTLTPPQGNVGPTTVGGPVPNTGAASAALAKVALAVRILESTIPELGSGSEPGTAVIKAVQGLSKISQGQGHTGTDQTALLQLLMQQRQEAPMLQALKAQQLRQGLTGGAGGAPGQAPGGTEGPGGAPTTGPTPPPGADETADSGG